MRHRHRHQERDAYPRTGCHRICTGQLRRRLQRTVPDLFVPTPYFFTAFENTGAVTTGIKAAYRRRGKKSLVVGIAGDGGTFDIGLQALSSALDRNEDIVYVCVDNEAFMNTGIQRSSSTPFGAWTTTSPVGSKVQGKRTFKKDLMKIGRGA